MLNFGNSDKAIKGLAKIIAQEPTFPERLRNDQKLALQKGAMKNNPSYIKQQEEILKKAEEIGLSQTGYIFNIGGEDLDNREGYMIYKKVVDEMVPFVEAFKLDPRRTIQGTKGIMEYSKQNSINNLITFDPEDQSKFYSHPWDNFEEVDEGIESGEEHGCYAHHLEANLDNYDIKKLQENGISYHEMDEDVSREFVHKLKIIEE